MQRYGLRRAALSAGLMVLTGVAAPAHARITRIEIATVSSPTFDGTPFAERMASGDPRLSLEERYSGHGSYVRAVTASAHDLERRRLLLDEDAERYIKAAEESDIGR